jgi:light-regulated signal transduction histidine kinase (bacteriophytochrome)
VTALASCWSDQDHDTAEETYRALLEAVARHASHALKEPLRGSPATPQAYVFRLLDQPGARGSGAGAELTISRRILERHGGQMWVRSAPERGTTFYFTV